MIYYNAMITVNVLRRLKHLLHDEHLYGLIPFNEQENNRIY